MKVVNELKTEVQDGFYIDIAKIVFEVDSEDFKSYVNKCLSLIDEHNFTGIQNDINNLKFIKINDYLSDEGTTDVDSKLDTEIITVRKTSIVYRGYNKWTADFCEVYLNEFMK